MSVDSSPLAEERSGRLIRAQEMFDRASADPRGVLAEAESLVAETRRTGDRRAYVRALCALAWAERLLLREVSAKRRLDLAIRLAVHPVDRVEALNCRAAVYQDLGRNPAAGRDLTLAQRLLDEEVARPGHDPVEVSGSAVRVRSQLGTLLQNAGRLTEAEVLFRQVLDEPEIGPRLRAIVGHNLALLLAYGGRHREALTLIDTVMGAAVAAGPGVESALLTCRGWVTVQSGALIEGLRLLDLASRVVMENQVPLAVAEHLLDRADASLDLRLVPEALQAARDALRRFEESGARLMMAEALLRVAQVELLAGSFQDAEQSAVRAADEFGAQRRPGWRAQALLVATEVRIARGDGGPGPLGEARRAARTLESNGFADSAVRAHLAAGRMASQLGQLRPATQSLTRAEAVAPRAPILVRLHGRLAAALKAELTGDVARALQHSRRGLELLDRHRAELPSQRLRAAASGHGVELGRIGLGVALRRRSARRTFEWMERTRAASITTSLGAARDGDLAATLSRLGEQLLIEYAVFDGQLVAVVLGDGRVRLVELGPEAPVRSGLGLLQFALRRLLRGPQDGRRDAMDRARRSMDLIRERVVPTGVDPERPLVVVPASFLRSVPWPVLHSGPVTLSPSAWLWVQSAADRPPPPRRVVLVAGPGLAGAVEEVGRLSSIHPQSTRLTGADGTVAAAVASMRSADLAHLACHGHVRADNPMFSSLELSDGPLTAQSLETGEAVPARMVLSACNVAADAGLPGGEQLGFVSALLARGTQGLIASLTLVPDLDAVEFMVIVHRALAAGLTMAQALHAARSGTEQDDPLGLAVTSSFVCFGGG